MREGNICETSSPRESREALREKGQFWTPAWVAEAMVEYVLPKGGGVLFDPAVGTGAFFRAAKKVAGSKRVPVRFAGMEIDPSVLERASESGISREDLSGVTIGDFVLHPPRAKFPAIAGNPPYIRHHRLPPEKKACLKALGAMITGESLDGRAGLHVYFLIRALSLLEKGGRLAFIVPADTCEGKFALQLWTWITANFALDAVITFSPEASPFPNIDTNPLILLIRHAPPNRKFLWARCVRQRTSSLREWIGSGCPPVSLDDLFSIERDLSEGLKTGFSRKPSPVHAGRYVLGDFVSVMRGIATGANRFFLMTAKQIREMKLPGKYFVRAIGRTRDIPDDEITDETLCRLERSGRPTLLLSLDGADEENFPEPLRWYLREGERLGLPRRPLISRRNPWYKMEKRVPPPFLFAYLGRRRSRFIRNTASAVPLTGFLCVYPKKAFEKQLDRIWKILNHPDTFSNLQMVGKSYGSGAIKVEPRLLERLPIPDHVVEQSGISLFQGRLF